MLIGTTTKNISLSGASITAGTAITVIKNTEDKLCFVEKMRESDIQREFFLSPRAKRQCGSIPILKPAHREEVDFGAYYQIAYDDEDD